ncbi:type I polyketide synthase [Streptomyces gelaticus]
MSEFPPSPAAASTAPEPIAVTGLSCRLPGAADPTAFWQMLRQAEHGIREVPDGRWDTAADDRATPGTRLGGFLENADGFDAAFFSVSPHEAAMMDPQQRLALELAWEALESAGTAPTSLGDSRTGVFVGAISGDYAALVARGGPDAVTQHTMTGLERGLIANRVSYHLGLRGPSMTVDAAQASSLVAVHLACESLRSGESETTLAGGVHLNLSEEGALAVARFGGLSPDGRSYTFDERANGFVRGEGGGFVVLKLLSRALADGDRIHCLIRGSAVNNDGRTDGLTRPSPKAQADVLRWAYAHAGVDPADVGYVELHGTGTPVGDPVEASALGEVLGTARPAGTPLPVGSAKTNVGHLEGAAGIVGLLKTVLSIAHEEVPASLNFERPNPEIPLRELNLRVPTRLMPWPAGEAPRRAGVSSFGMGGTNVHVVLEEAPASESAVDAVVEEPSGVVPFVLSARSRGALAELAGRLADGLPDVPLGGLGWALQHARTRFEHRAVVVADNRQDLLSALQGLRDEQPDPRTVTGAVSGRGGKTVFVFPGQGSQWPDMARQLAEEEPVFARHLAECADALAPYTAWNPHQTLLNASGAASLDDVAVVQPALWAVMVSLARLWQHYGVHPDAVVGHSQGEIAAAHIAGALSLDDAARVVALRSRALRTLAGTGGMLSVNLSADEAEQLLGPWRDLAHVAALNAPDITVLAGEAQALAAIREHCEQHGIRARAIAVDYASHSPHVEPLADDIRSVLADIRPTAAEVPFFSTVTGSLLDTTALTGEYWFTNLRQPVLLHPTLTVLAESGYTRFVEASAHPILTTAIRTTLEHSHPHHTTTGTLTRDHGARHDFLLATAHAHVQGHTPTWHIPAPRTTPNLPTYPFQRQRHWITTTTPTPHNATVQPLPRAAAEADAPVPALVRRALDAAGDLRAQVLLDGIRAHMMTVLGYANPEEIDATSTFRDLGVESLTAVQLRDRLADATGLSLPSSLLYDHPTPDLLAAHLLAELTDGEGAAEAAGPVRREALPADDPIAIVSMGCRFPGGADTPERLWQLVADGTDAISEFPVNRGWDLDALYDPDPDNPRTSYVRHGGFLHDADRFDPEFFGISPREALAIDPQQRLMMEVVWEAVERAGIDPASLHGSRTGVYVGAMAQDYGPRLHEDAQGLEGYRLTGSTTSVASGRLAYLLGLKGPAITVDTACSSSLVALHLAVRSLRQGECSLALAGGVTVMSSAGIFLEFSRQRGLAADGRCKPFAAAADGTGWGEGAGVLVLERLSDARRNGHPVLALIRGSAVNQDGASNGLAAPNGPAQQQAIDLALADAGLAPDAVELVEAHGTGTTLGDPIEAHALLKAYGRGRPAERPLWLGSLKSNIGHAQAAAGVGGIIKTVMALRHGLMPRTLHVDEPTPHVDWAAGHVRLLTEKRAWPAGEAPRRAGVSSFGISGTNVHVVLEEAPASESAVDAVVEEPSGVVPFVLSARSRGALAELAGRLADGLPDVRLGGLVWALQHARTRFEHRAVVVADNRQDLLSALQGLRDEQPDPRTVTGAVSGRGGKTVFVFPGQGSQWPDMARQLAEEEPVFARHLAECADALAPYTAWNPHQTLLNASGAASLDDVAVVQPALWAVMVSLARLWQHYGVHPDAVVGHSQGEIAAAHIAGALSLDDAARVVALRSRALRTLAGTGGMLSVNLSADEAEQLLGPWRDLAHVAALNAPDITVLAGEAQALAAIREHCEQHGIRARAIAVDYASHSPHVEPLADDIRSVLADIRPTAAEVPFFSTVTGSLLDTTALTGEYWFTNLRQPVLLHPTLTVLAESGYTRFVEASAHPILTTAIRTTLEHSHPHHTTTGTLTRDHGARHDFLLATAHAHVQGHTPTWHIPAPRTTPNLPTYPFQRQRHWITTTTPTPHNGHHPLFSAETRLAENGGLLLTGRLSVTAHPWLEDHAVAGSVVLPGTAFVELVLHAGDRVGHDLLAELTLEAPLVFPARSGAVQVQLAVGADEAGRRTVHVYGRPDDADGDAPWTRHATAVLETGPAVHAGEDLAGEWPPPGAQPVSVADLYERLAATGYAYGPAFQGLRALWRRGDELFADVALPEEGEEGAEAFGLHPALCDAALHAVLAGTADDGLRLPFAWSGVTLHATGAAALRVRLVPTGEETYALMAADPVGGPVLSVDSLAFRTVTAGHLGAGARFAGDALHQVTWPEVPLPSGACEGDVLLVGTRPLGPVTPWCPDLAALGTAVEGGLELPRAVLLHCSSEGESGGGGTARKASDAARDALDTVRAWLGDERFVGARLVLVTGSATGSARLTQSPVWGLVRSAQTEHPGRFGLLEIDDSDASYRELPRALALGDEEPQLRLRDGALSVPRLSRLPEEGPDGGRAPGLDPDGTVLITGATGLLGGLLTRHLCRAYGMRHVLLVGRRGARADGMAELVADLESLGARVTVAACDVADRDALAGLLDTVLTEHPLTAVLHAAGVLDDASVTELTDDQLTRVLRPKVEAALNLHELTRGLDLAAFVLFSSVAGVLGNAGQANYAAGSVFLDALAEHRRSLGLPATSLAWGLWAEGSGMTGHLTRADVRRMARAGLGALDTEEGLALFDACLSRGDATLVPARLDLTALRERAASHEVPPLLRGLVRPQARRTAAARAAGTEDLAQRLASLPPDEQQQALMRLVEAHTATVLGHPRELRSRRTAPSRIWGSTRCRRSNCATG